MADANEIIQKWSQGIARTADGTVVCPVEWQLRMEDWQKAVDARQEALSATLAALHAKVDLLTTGGVDTAAVVQALLTQMGERLADPNVG